MRRNAVVSFSRQTDKSLGTLTTRGRLTEYGPAGMQVLPDGPAYRYMVSLPQRTTYLDAGRTAIKMNDTIDWDGGSSTVGYVLTHRTPPKRVDIYFEQVR